MSLTTQFPDQMYMEQIRQHLWSGREFGRAAVMVGAGFSRNSEKVTHSVPDFPLWWNLAEKMFDSLHPPTGREDQNRQELRSAKISGTPLRLASEYEAAFTRPAMDELIISITPDNGYRPGNIHRLLLSLPWADVFTTNYDTLLERTRPFIHDRKYDLILNASDVSTTSRPRIVKLHGSFPSQRPFIVTEEDFRTYPQKFSPFVNLVQQSIVENALCLLGFSGSDPNFLNWTGWVRDHLGDHAPPVYLCGILNLPTFERKLLESRKVIPIDLSPLFPAAVWPDREVRHKKAMEWFLLSLLYGAPPNVIHWPKSVREMDWKASEGLPEPLPSPRPLSPIGERAPKHNRPHLLQDELQEIHQVWRRKREEYPGWVVTPQDNREKLWEHTKQWFEPILNSIDKLDLPESLLLLYELNWRLEKSLTPYPAPYAERVLAVIEQFNPFPSCYSNQAQFYLDRGESASWPWQQIASCWVELLFAVIRTWRENLNRNQFLPKMEAIKDLVKQKVEWECRWHYESCLFFLVQSDFNRVRAVLSEWKATPELPFWETKRAAVMAEIGDLEDARQTAENALAGIRLQFMPGTTDHSLLSQEGWTMLLLRGIRMNRFDEDSGYLDQFTDRWEKLTIYRCNPWPEIETLETIVKGMTPPQDVFRETQRGYHPKSENVTYHMLGETAYSKLQPAFNFLRIFEEGGIPIRAGVAALFTEAVLNAARCISEFAPSWAWSSQLRASVSPDKEDWLDLATVADLSDEAAGYAYQVFRDSFIEALAHLLRHPEEIRSPFGSTAFRRATTFADLLSRLSPRVSEQQIDDLLQLAIATYLSPVTRSRPELCKCQGILFDRAMEAAAPEQKLRLLPKLLSLPIPGEAGFDVSLSEQWDDPFMHFSIPINSIAISSLDHSTLAPIITNLVRIIRDGQFEARWRAILRLSHLHEIKILTEQETKEFAQALWSKLDDSGLPADTNLLKNGALLLPEPTPGIAKERIRAYLLSKDFYRQAREINSPGQQGVQFGLSFSVQHPIREWLQATAPVPLKGEIPLERGIDWGKDEIIILLNKIVSWWNDQKRFLNQSANIDSFIVMADDNLRRDFDGLADLLMRVILPRMIDVEEEHRNIVVTLMTELDENGIVVLSAWPLVLFLDPSLYGKVAERIQFALFSNDRKKVERAILGLSNWIIYSSKSGLPSAPTNFLSHLVSIIATRRKLGLDVALQYSTILLQSVPDVFEEKHLELILLALDALIEETDVRAESGNIDKPDKPYLRIRAASLSYQLSKYYQQQGKALPETIERWQMVCKNDPLIHVKRVWVN